MDEGRRLETNSLSRFRLQSNSLPFTTLFKTVHRTQLSDYYLMRFLFTLIIVLLGVNLIVDLLDSDMKTIIEERNQSIEKMINE
tara:strand:+ start:2407 stop:2658 length:252 start_codon:yes stop_codon:yes gene_type:complete